jgi:hypothetical protein
MPTLKIFAVGCNVANKQQKSPLISVAAEQAGDGGDYVAA